MMRALLAAFLAALVLAPAASAYDAPPLRSGLSNQFPAPYETDRYLWTADTPAGLQAFDPGDVPGFEVFVRSAGKYRWDRTSALAADGRTVILPNNRAGNGRWLKEPDPAPVVCQGVDDTAALQAAVTGGPVKIAGATCAVSAAVAISANGVQIECVGGLDSFHNNAALTLSGTTFKWIGQAGGTMVQFSPGNGAATYQRGGVFKGCNLDGQSSAAIGLEVLSHRHGHFEVSARNFTSEALHVGVVASLTNDAADAQENDFRLSADQRGVTGSVLLCDGSATANCSHNRFNVDADVLNGQGVVFAGSDNNWARVRVFRGLTFTPTATGPNDLEFQGGASAALAARNNVIDTVTAGSQGTNQYAIYARGTQSGYASTSHDNIIRMTDATNATPTPVRDVSATLFVDGVIENSKCRTWSSGFYDPKFKICDSGAWLFTDIVSFGRAEAAYRKVTVDATPVSMFANGSNTLIVPSNTSVWGAQMVVACLNPDSGEAASWTVNFTAKRTGGTTALVGSPVFTLVASDFSVDPTTPALVVDASGGITAQVTGKAATTLDWSGRILAAVGGANGN